MNNTTSKTESLKERLGSDLSFPIVGNFRPVSGVDLVIQDIQLLLLTLPGERVNRPTFGCGLRGLVWENMATVAASGQAAISSAIANFEPRVTLKGIDFVTNENTGLVVYNIRFVINQTDTPVNLIFPFRQGTTLSFA